MSSHRIIPALVASALLAVGCSSSQATSADEVVGVDEAGLVSRGGHLLAMGKCLQVVGRREVAGARVEIAQCDRSPAQSWTYTSKTTLVSPGGLCLTVDGTASQYANYLTVRPCATYSIEQMFRINRSGEIRGTTVDARDRTLDDRRCLDVYGSGTADGTMVWYHDCNGSNAQQWSSDDGLAWKKTSLLAMGNCLDLPDGNSYDGAPLQMYHCTGGSNQSFWISPLGRITDDGGQRCLTVGGAVSPYANGLSLQTCIGNDAQQSFTFAGTSIRTDNQARCLDVRGSGTGDHTPVWIHDCNGTAAQQWAHSGCSRTNVSGRCAVECCTISGGSSVCGEHPC